MLNAKRILILAPHTDDGEFGCGGTIAKMIDQGADVHYVAFSAAEESVPDHLPRDILRKEVLQATAELGIPHDNTSTLDYRVRKFQESRQEILEDLVRLNRELRPDIVFTPSQNDCHQDHFVIAVESVRAFKKTTLLGYEIPWNNLVFHNTCYVVINQQQIDTKVAALNCYNSQKHRQYATEEFIRSLAITRGAQIGQPFAELYEVIRWVIN